MRGLIYKECSIFYKSMDKRMLLMTAGFSALILYSAGIYGGLMASVLLSMTIGIQNVMSFASDDKARWKKYQLTLPLSSFTVVASKYISVLCTLGISVLGSIVLSLLSSIFFRSFNLSVWTLALCSSVVIPLLWTGVCLPLTYWFSMQSAQTMGLFLIIPLFYLIKHFEDGAGLSAMTVSLSSYLGAAGILAVVVFGVSLVFSIIGYARKK